MNVLSMQVSAIPYYNVIRLDDGPHRIDHVQRLVERYHPGTPAAKAVAVGQVLSLRAACTDAEDEAAPRHKVKRCHHLD